MFRLSNNFLFIILCITLALILNFGFRFNSDEGLVLNGAWNLYNGKILYQDFYEFFGPASLSLINFVFIIFSPTYYSALFFSIAFLLISAYFLYRISLIILVNVFWAKVSTVSWIILASLAYPVINHNAYSTFLTIIFTYFFLNLVKTKKRINGIIAGITAALIFYFLQTKGVAILLVSSIFLLLLKRKNIITKKNLNYFYLAYFFSIGLGIILWGRHPISVTLKGGSGYLQQSYYQLSLLPFMIFLVVFF